MGSRKQTLITIMKLKTFDYMHKVANMDKKQALDYVQCQVKKWQKKTTADLEIINKGL